VSLDIHGQAQDVVMISKPGMFTVSRLIKVLIDTNTNKMWCHIKL